MIDVTISYCKNHNKVHPNGQGMIFGLRGVSAAGMCHLRVEQSQQKETGNQGR